jgi:hypothetical protein
LPGTRQHRDQQDHPLGMWLNQRFSLAPSFLLKLRLRIKTKLSIPEAHRTAMVSKDLD